MCRTDRPSTVGGHLSMWQLQSQLQLGAVRVAATSVYELQPLGLHNKFTKIYKVHKKF
jgi:hypothetical protein